MDSAGQSGNGKGQGYAKVSRRQFLHSGALGAAGLWLTSCSSLDRIILGESQDSSEQVAILGAGLAGLMAAFELKKSGMMFHVYEASERVGGRIYSVPEFFRGQSVAELGAEFFSASQNLVFEVAKELRVEIVEVPDQQRNLRLRKLNRIVPVSDLQRELPKLQKSNSRNEDPEELRKLSLVDWVKTRSRDTAFQDLMQVYALEKYGTDASSVSAEFFAASFDQMKNPLQLWSDQLHRFRSGSAALTQALFDRTAGFQVDKTYSFRHRLKAVHRRARGMDLVFVTPEGEKTVFARRVICSLPLSILKEVEGIQEFAGPWQDPGAFEMGSHSKFIYAYPDRFWAKSFDQGKVLQMGVGQTLWESSYRLNPLFQFRQGVLSFLWGGEAAKQAGLEQRDSLRREIESLLQRPSEVEVLEQAMVNWRLQPFAKGSVSYPQVGRAQGGWVPDSAEWQWAGEHVTWADRGTLQGALTSGRQAARNLIEQKNTSSVASLYR